MNLRTTLAALLLAAAPITPAAAQVEWRITGFTQSPFGTNGFSGNLEFRINTGFDVQPITSIRELRLGVSKRASDACGLRADCTGLFIPYASDPRSTWTTGNVDKRTFTTADGAKWVYDYQPNNADSCGVSSCFNYLLDVGSFGVFGCALPTIAPGTEPVRFHAGRTCAAEGFDGWIRVPFQFRGLLGVTMTYSEADITPTFTLQTFNVPNSYVPEPSAYLLMGTGLLGIAAVARSQRRRSP